MKPTTGFQYDPHAAEALRDARNEGRTPMMGFLFLLAAGVIGFLLGAAAMVFVS